MIPPDDRDRDTFPPTEPATEPEMVIAIGEAELRMSRALDKLVAAFDEVERVSMACARALDAQPTR